MKVKILPEGVIKEIKGNKRIKELLKELNLNPESYVVLKNGEILTEDITVKDEDSIEIVSVISGGIEL